MSAFSGQQGKGAKKLYREQKRAEAVARNECFNGPVQTWCGHSHATNRGKG